MLVLTGWGGPDAALGVNFPISNRAGLGGAETPFMDWNWEAGSKRIPPIGFTGSTSRFLLRRTGAVVGGVVGTGDGGGLGDVPGIFAGSAAGFVPYVFQLACVGRPAGGGILAGLTGGAGGVAPGPVFIPALNEDRSIKGFAGAAGGLGAGFGTPPIVGGCISGLPAIAGATAGSSAAGAYTFSKSARMLFSIRFSTEAATLFARSGGICARS